MELRSAPVAEVEDMSTQLGTLFMLGGDEQPSGPLPEHRAIISPVEQRSQLHDTGMDVWIDR